MSDNDTWWNGRCPAGRHGLDYEDQPCDLCRHESETVMSPANRDRTLQLRLLARHGKPLTRAESKFLERMHQQYPDEYGHIGAEAWNESAAAIGSTARLPPGERR